MKDRVAESLRCVVAMSDDMIQLAHEGAQQGDDVGSGIVFGMLRDAGYNLRRLAEQELDRRGLVDAPPESPEPYPFDRSQGTTSLANAVRSLGEGADGAPKKVLVIDDEPDVVTYIETWFADRGFDVATAEDGYEAIERAARFRPDLITLDMSMPERSGLEVFRLLKDSKELSTVPVIIITAIGNPLRGLLDDGARIVEPEGLLSKPIDLRDLAVLVKRLVA